MENLLFSKGYSSLDCDNLIVLTWTKSAPLGSITHQQEGQVSTSTNRDLNIQKDQVTNQLPHKSKVASPMVGKPLDNTMAD
uniref:Uncharacterized protein n=1 Tax=Cannabis sativa TaxID=3483 RepID=A0A803PBK3_CANSA